MKANPSRGSRGSGLPTQGAKIETNSNLPGIYATTAAATAAPPTLLHWEAPPIRSDGNELPCFFRPSIDVRQASLVTSVTSKTEAEFHDLLLHMTHTQTTPHIHRAPPEYRYLPTRPVSASPWFAVENQSRRRARALCRHSSAARESDDVIRNNNTAPPHTSIAVHGGSRAQTDPSRRSDPIRPWCRRGGSQSSWDPLQSGRRGGRLYTRLMTTKSVPPSVRPTCWSRRPSDPANNIREQPFWCWSALSEMLSIGVRRNQSV